MTTNIIDDIIFEKCREGKIDTNKTILLLEASIKKREQL